MSACIRQTAASRPKFVFPPTFMFCSPICSNNCGVVFLWKYILVFEKWFFSFDRSNMQIFTANITRVVWPHVTIPLDLRHFCQHNPLFYHLKLIPCHYWSWQRITTIIRTYWATKHESRRENEFWATCHNICPMDADILS